MQQLKVLVVEDDLPSLEFMCEALTSLGVGVQPINDSQLAASLVNQEKFDGIFLDLTMPEVDGFELARQIRQSSWNKRTPIVIVTGRDDKQTLGQAFEAGGTFFLQKPVEMGRLVRLLNSTRGAMLAERRRYRRISIRTEIVCEVGPRKINYVSSNLSPSGLLFEGNGSVQPGDTVRLKFHLPGQVPAIKAAGVVVRIDKKQRIGVYFTHMSMEDKQRLGDFIASQPDNSFQQNI